MLRIFAIASLVMLGASPIPSAAAPEPLPAIVSAPVHTTVYHGPPSAREAMNQSVAYMAVRAAAPGTVAASLSQRDRLALLMLLSLHGASAAATR